jgi:hypothetical protein
MATGFEKRLARLEQLAVSEKQKNICNCRLETKFHNADCLAAILQSTSRVCPDHGFREFGFFFWQSKQFPLGSGDDAFCPCPPHPWRSYVLRKTANRPTPEMLEEASRVITPYDIADERRRLDILIAEYLATRLEWAAKTRRALPTKQELKKIVWKRVREYAN